MAEEIKINTQASKMEQYQSLIPQIAALIEIENDVVANLANIAAALRQQFQWWWVGFYLVKNEELVLGPFQGPVACTRIAKDKGVCGKAWAQKQTLIVPDVDAFPGHIACSGASRSEIVVPIIKNEIVLGVLDVDSEFLNHFDEVDAEYLNELMQLLIQKLA